MPLPLATTMILTDDGTCSVYHRGEIHRKHLWDHQYKHHKFAMDWVRFSLVAAKF